MPDALVQSAIHHWAPRFVSNGVPLTDFEEVTAKLERWEDWCEAWCQCASLHEGIGRAALKDHLAKAVEIARSLVEGLDYVGVMGVELFEMADGALWVNEIAPRVHNTGHWTLDACEVDQFEQHIRAIAGWPLGPTQPFAAAEMINLLGADSDQWAKLAGDPGARLWLYGKSGAAPGRKMGHVNRLTGPFPS